MQKERPGTANRSAQEQLKERPDASKECPGARRSGQPKERLGAARRGQGALMIFKERIGARKNLSGALRTRPDAAK